IFSLGKNTLRTVSRTPVPQAGRLADGRVPSPVSSFLNLSQVPVDRGARIPYTVLAFSLASQTKNKAMSEIWKTVLAPNLARFYWLILQQALSGSLGDCPFLLSAVWQPHYALTSSNSSCTDGSGAGVRRETTTMAANAQRKAGSSS